MDRSSTSCEELSMPFRAVCGIILALFCVFGLAGNINVLHVCRHQQPTLNRITRWILVNLAIFDLISCLVNYPAVFSVVVVNLTPRDKLVHILCLTTVCITRVTLWGNCACLVLLAIVREDATVRVFFPQRITLQRLKKLVIFIWLVYALMFCGLFYVYHEFSGFARRPKTFQSLIAKKMPLSPITIVMLVVTTGYVLKCYYNIRKFLNTQNNVMEVHIGACQANSRREVETKLAKVMLQVSLVFAVTVIPPFAFRFFHASVSPELFAVGRLAALVHQITNPFIYSSINKDFVRFLFCFKDHCSRCTSSVSPLNPDEDILNQGVAPNGHDYPMRLEIVEDEIMNSVSDVSGNMDRTQGQQNCTHLLTDMTFANEQHVPSGYYV